MLALENCFLTQNIFSKENATIFRKKTVPLTGVNPRTNDKS